MDQRPRNRRRKTLQPQHTPLFLTAYLRRTIGSPAPRLRSYGYRTAPKRKPQDPLGSRAVHPVSAAHGQPGLMLLHQADLPAVREHDVDTCFRIVHTEGECGMCSLAVMSALSTHLVSQRLRLPDAIVKLGCGRVPHVAGWHKRCVDFADLIGLTVWNRDSHCPSGLARIQRRSIRHRPIKSTP